MCFREIKHLVQCHTAGNGQNEDISPCRTDSMLAFLNTTLLASYAFLFVFQSHFSGKLWCSVHFRLAFLDEEQ